jgi:hypothetical protein
VWCDPTKYHLSMSSMYDSNRALNWNLPLLAQEAEKVTFGLIIIII